MLNLVPNRDALASTATQRLMRIMNPREEITIEPTSPALLVSEKSSIRSVATFLTVVVVFLFGLAWLNRPQTISEPVVAISGTPLAAVSASTTPLMIVVDVEGAVRNPGLKTLPAGSRIADAIKAAGGLRKRLPGGSINLAEKVSDGQLIVVSSTSNRADSTNVNANQTAGGTQASVNLNTATADQLDALPGVGPVMSSRILAWRVQHQGFSSIEELQEVPGIGPKVFANLKPLVRI